MKKLIVFAGLALLIVGARSVAQTTVPVPSLEKPMPCGSHDDIDVLCGANHPEDIEQTPDGRYLIATAFLSEHPTGPVGGGMELFDLQKKTFSKMTIIDEPERSWGDPACPGPLDDALVSHGESLAKRRDGKWALYVVNHAKRESIEMFELRDAGGSWSLIWHGCEIGAHPYYDALSSPMEDSSELNRLPSFSGARKKRSPRNSSERRQSEYGRTEAKGCHYGGSGA